MTGVQTCALPIFAPASGAVELRDDSATIFQKHLEDPVFIGIELQDAAVAAQADGVECVQDLCWCQLAEAHGRPAGPASTPFV